MPVFHDDKLRAAVCISAPVNRLAPDRYLSSSRQDLLEAGNELELRLRFPDR